MLGTLVFLSSMLLKLPSLLAWHEKLRCCPWGPPDTPTLWLRVWNCDLRIDWLLLQLCLLFVGLCGWVWSGVVSRVSCFAHKCKNIYATPGSHHVWYNSGLYWFSEFSCIIYYSEMEAEIWPKIDQIAKIRPKCKNLTSRGIISSFLGEVCKFLTQVRATFTY